MAPAASEPSGKGMTSESPEAEEDLTIRDLVVSVEVLGVDLTSGEGGSG